jgi:hypothetical protein
MHSRLKLFLPLVLVMIVSNALTTVPYFSIRSQGLNAARELAGWTNHIHLYDQGGIYGSFSITPEFTRSFKSRHITECLFETLNTSTNACAPCVPTCQTTCSSCCTNGCITTPTCTSDCASIVVSGSHVPGRSCNDWLADYFGLPTDFKSTISFKPHVSNFLVDFNLYLGFDKWLCGLYMEVKFPIVYTRWHLKPCEVINTPGTFGYDAGYFTPGIPVLDRGTNAIPNGNLLRNFQSFMNGCVPNLPNVIFNPLKNSKISFCRQSKGGIAEIRAIVGWDFLQGENYHFGLNLRTAAPIGTRPEGNFLFEPMVGNGHHWELGFGLTTHWTFWKSNCSDSNLSFWVEANLTHLFKTRQRRSFDLCGNGPNSRYMLAQKLGTPVTNLFAGATQAAAVAPAAQFKNEFTPVANLSTVDVKVSSNIQADIVALFNYSNCGYSLDVGYNFWGRSCEKIKRDCSCASELFDGNTWALKGDAHVFGFTRTDATTAPGYAIGLSATQSTATINAGLNTPCGTSFIQSQIQNPNIDSPTLAFASAPTSHPTDQLQAVTNFPAFTVSAAPINTSLSPVFLNENSLDLKAARTKGLSSTLFAHFSYTWFDNDCLVPYLGIGGKVEWAHHRRKTKCEINCCVPTPAIVPCGTGNCITPCSTGCDINRFDNCSNCKSCNLSEWSIWIKTGFSFN